MDRYAVAYPPIDARDVPPELSVVAQVAGGLPEALRPIAGGVASTLLVRRLRDAGRSLPDLIALLDWLDGAGADLLALDVGLDTSTRAGRHTVAVLREVARWSAGPPRGRPGLKHAAPDLAERLAQLRDRGLSLQAIADTLNAEGVPTPRGGARWRPSSVQAALGYRRPRPPLPGAPPPRPKPPLPGGPSPRRKPAGPSDPLGRPGPPGRRP